MMVGASNKDIACRILYQMSTLLNILGGIDTPTSGEYYLNKNNIATLSNKKIADIRNIEFGFVLQYFGLINDYTVYENYDDFLSKNTGTFYYMTRYGRKPHTSCDFSNRDDNIYLVFGKEKTEFARTADKNMLSFNLSVKLGGGKF